MDMAGGKETPRQKMVGLMYLVLMALLALNVTKEVLNAFVAIEENVQKGALNQLERGNASKADMIEALNDVNVEKVKKVKYYLGIIEQIDKETDERIREIDEIKFDILRESGEQIEIAKNKDEETILWKASSKKDPLRPARLNLMAVQAKDQYDIPMHKIIGEDLTDITGSGKDLWENYNNYRNKLCDLVGTYSPPNGKVWSFKSTNINKYKDNADLEKQVDKMMAKNKFNVADDAEPIKNLYMELTKNERFDTEEVKNIHWIGKTFDHSPLVAALASLTSLQQEILTARATAVTHIKNRVTVGDYSFNKIMALAYGPSIANANEEIEIGVMMAAFDSDNQPVVTGPGVISVADGRGKIKVKVNGSGEMVLNGTVSIKKKSGEMKTEKWSHTIKIMKPQGTISQIGMNVFYRNYENLIEGVVSGYDQTIISPASGSPQLIKSGNRYIVKPGAGRTCSLTVSGKSSVTNKSVTLGTYEYKVVNLPKPTLYMGTFEDGKDYSVSAVKSIRKIFERYPPEILLNATFKASGWTLEVTTGSVTASESGPGDVLTPKAIALLNQVKSGSKVSITATYTGPSPSGKNTCKIKVI